MAGSSSCPRWAGRARWPLFPEAFSGPAPMIAALQVSVDIFKGFPDEESIVNYTLNQAYQDNVTVFASEFSLLPQGPLSPTRLCSHQPSPTQSLLCPVLFQFLGPDLFPSSLSSHVSPFSLACFTLLPHSTCWLCLMSCPSVLFHLSICLISTPGVLTSQCVPPLLCTSSGHILHHPPVPRCDLPDTEGWLPPSPCTL